MKSLEERPLSSLIAVIAIAVAPPALPFDDHREDAGSRALVAGRVLDHRRVAVDRTVRQRWQVKRPGRPTTLAVPIRVAPS